VLGNPVGLNASLPLNSSLPLNASVPLSGLTADSINLMSSVTDVHGLLSLLLIIYLPDSDASSKKSIEG
jgi:hypothetical protein